MSGVKCCETQIGTRHTVAREVGEGVLVARRRKCERIVRKSMKNEDVLEKCESDKYDELHDEFYNERLL